MLIDAEMFSEALTYLDAAQQWMRTRKVSSERRGIVAFKRAEALGGLDVAPEAERDALVAVRRFDEAGLPTNHDLRAHAGLILGEALNGQGRWREAVAPFQQTAAIWQASGANPERLAWARWGLAHSLCRLPDRRPEAQRAADRALELVDVIEPNPDGHKVLQQQLASICHLR
jgi:tetratricopeptide (TPR) repeat protein